MKKYFIPVSIAIALTVHGCRKQYALPDPSLSPAGVTISVQEIKSRFITNPAYYRFSGDTCVTGVVTADETSGNLYREIFIRDNEGHGIQVKLKTSGGVYTGDEVRIHLNGLYCIYANGMAYVDSAEAGTTLIKRSSGHAVHPKQVTITDVLRYASDPLHAGSLQSQLVEITGVEFIPTHRGVCFADAVSKTGMRRTLADCAGNELQVNTSGFANFAGKVTPQGKGSIAGIVTQFNSAMGFGLRSYYDVRMSGQPCQGSSTVPVFTVTAPVEAVFQSFDQVQNNVEFSAAGWISHAESGGVKWKGNLKGESYRSVKASAYGSGEINKMWLIAPPVIFKPTSKVSFKTAVEFWDSGHPDAINAFVSTDFNGSNFATANWTLLPGAVYAGGGSGNYSGAAGMISSGEIPLSEMPLFKNFTGSFFVAFRYSGNQKYDSNVFLDDVVIE